MTVPGTFTVRQNKKHYFYVATLIFTICYTFIYSSGGMIDISNHDYMYYMHLCSNSNYKEYPMISGTMLLYKPLNILFGNSYWMWQKFHWLLNLTILFIPFFCLLNYNQRRSYLIVAVLLVLTASNRIGCEPPRLVYFFLSIALTSLIKYHKSKRFLWIIIISICLSFIAYVRFPSLFVYPVITLAVMCLSNNIKHKITIILLPLITFFILISLTSGDIQSYFYDLSNSLKSTSSGSHSIKQLFIACIQSVFCDTIYSIVILLPFILFSLWNKRKKKIFFIASFICLALSVFCIFHCPPSGNNPTIHLFNYTLSLIFYHPIPQLYGTLFIAILILYLRDSNFNKSNIAIGFAIVFASMLASTGSDFGFIHEYMSIAFLPFIAINTPSIHPNKKHINPMRLIFLCLCYALILSTLYSQYKKLNHNYYNEGTINVINGGIISDNLNYVFFGKQDYNRMSDMQYEYNRLKIKYTDVVFWGWWSYYMSLANNKWPIRSEWDISSKDSNGKALNDLKDYSSAHKVTIIDTEKHVNTEKLLSSLGYIHIEKQYYRVYIPQHE